MDDVFKRRLKRRLKAFLKGTRNRSYGRTEAFRENAIEVLQRATSRRWRTYIVGGAIRDLMLRPSGSWPRDVDVMVQGCSQREVADAFSDIVVHHNSFGGLRLRKTVEIGKTSAAKHDLLFDLWRLEDTWAIKTGNLPPTIQSFVKTPFLNIDSVAVDVEGKRGTIKIYESGFFEAIATKTLEINNEHNPFPAVCIVRSLLLAAKLNFWIGPRLALFVKSNSKMIPTSEIVKAQVLHYGRINCFEERVDEWLGIVRQQLEEGNMKVRLTNGPEMQLRLWRESPPDNAGAAGMFT
jgi:hypothetical protein